MLSTLDEVNARVGTLTDEKAALGDKRESLERELHEVEKALKEEKERVEAEKKAAREAGERAQAEQAEQSTAAEKVLVAEKDATAKAISRAEECEARAARAEEGLAQQKNVLDEVTHASRTSAAELETARKDGEERAAQLQSLRAELEDARKEAADARKELGQYQEWVTAAEKAHADVQAGLERAKATEAELQQAQRKGVEEVKALRAELETLRASSSAEAPKINPELQRASPDNETTFDKMFVDSLAQQHELDLSNARSQIRSLETRIFEQEDARAKADRRVAELEDEIASLRATSSAPLPAPAPAPAPVSARGGLFAPPSTSAPMGSRAHRRSATAAHVPALPSLAEREPGPTPPMVAPSMQASTSGSGRRGIHAATPEELTRTLPPAQRHRRRESLQMLRARIADDIPSFNAPANSNRPKPSAMTPMPVSVYVSASGESAPGSADARAGAGDNTPTSAHSHKHTLSHERVLGPDPSKSLRTAGRVRRPQFANEQLLFCAACKGDLIIV